jgi:hypothetical protein
VALVLVSIVLPTLLSKRPPELIHAHE